MPQLSEPDRTISEFGYEVGFGRPSYFTKCVTDFEGYPHGETKRKLNELNEPFSPPIDQ
jgi:AraC-like DNA-binding protein